MRTLGATASEQGGALDLWFGANFSYVLSQRDGTRKSSLATSWRREGDGFSNQYIYKYRHSDPPCGFGMSHFSSVEDFV